MNLQIPLPPEMGEEIKQMFRSMAWDVIKEVKDQRNELKPFMTQKQCCEILGISFTTMQKWRNQGLKLTVIDGKTLVSRDTLIEFLKSHEI